MDVGKEIINFILEYWNYISIALVVIINLTLFLIKKKPIVLTDSLKQSILQLLPGVIAAAEEIIGSKHGAQKMDMVVETIKEWFLKNGFEFTDSYKKYVIECTENILSTPQKKGD